jgi:dTMP kinase
LPCERTWEALLRTLSGHPHLKYYQAGMDLGLSNDPIASFRAFQQRILAAYETMIGPYGLLCLDAVLPVKQLQHALRDAVEKLLPGED